MPKQKRIEYAEGFIRDVHDNGLSMGRFTFEVDKFLGDKWFMTTPVHLTFNLVGGISSDDVGKRLKVVLEFDNSLDDSLES
jgi:hypothetical protein